MASALEYSLDVWDDVRFFALFCSTAAGVYGLFGHRLKTVFSRFSF